MKKLVFITIPLTIFCLGFVLGTGNVSAQGVGAVADLMSVPVNDAKVREDVGAIRKKEVGVGSQEQLLKTAANAAGKIIGDIGKKAGTWLSKNIKIPVPNITIGGIDLGGFGDFLKGAGNIAQSLRGEKPYPPLDTLAITLGRLAMDKIFDDMTDWVNSGFEGNPAFAYDLGDYMKKVGDSVLGQYLYEIDSGFACQPFRLEIKAAISRDFGTRNRRGYLQTSCTLSERIGNVQGFLNGDFNQGGWPAWFQLTQVDENNPYGEYMVAVDNISIGLAGAKNLELTKLNWGAGFLGNKKCITYAKKKVIDYEAEQQIDPDTGEPYFVPIEKTEDDLEKCLVYEDRTPGKVVADQVNKVLGAGVDQIMTADEFNEFLGAIINQLTNRVFSTRGIITNTSGTGYRPEPITGTVDYGGGGSGGTSGSAGCSVSNRRPLVGQKMEWSIDLSLAEGTGGRFTWKGDEIEGEKITTSPTLEMTYTTPGEKRLSGITVSYSEPTGDFNPETQSYASSNTITKDISCTETVRVLQYAPITASCSADRTSAVQGGTPVIWTVTVSGGSGTLRDVWLTGNQDKEVWGLIGTADGNVPSGGYGVVRPSGGFINYANNRPILYSQSGNNRIYKFVKTYRIKETVGASLNVVDMDQNVENASNLECSTKVVVDD